MSRFHLLPLAFLIASVFAQQTVCADSPSSAPSPAPVLPADGPLVPSPSLSANVSSPPAPPPSPDLPPSPAPSPTNSTSNPSSPTPSPAPASGIDGINHTGVVDDDAQLEHSDGMSAAKKAGIAIGVIACGSFVVVGAMLYKKRQQNIRRSQYSSAARREFL